MTRVLGIESSCDETSAAIVASGYRVESNVVASQISRHAQFGGVVPEIASREHVKVISRVVRSALEEAGIQRPDVLAATNGPGLLGSLLVGVNFAKALAYAWELPFVPVHHIEGHLFSAFLDDSGLDWPFLALIVSGGHTQLIECDRPGAYRILGTTRDDAVGEAFDKVARLLGLPYPGGPSVEHAAQEGDPEAFRFPRAMRGSETFDFSFSGLKTAVLYALRDNPEASISDISASFQAAAVDTLIEKTARAVETLGASRLVVAGGVAANTCLREAVVRRISCSVFVPPMQYCTDNAAMIAAAGHARFEMGILGDRATSPSASMAL